MSIQAIIMAGGEGVRLRPLTVHTPKPLCPLLGEPVMGYALRLLKTHGVTDIGVTMWYQPQKIRRVFHKGEHYDVKLKYYEEKEPVGTAGSVKLARKQITDTFFVLSGDGLTDCDLTAALRFHKEKEALATLVLKRVSVPLPYGVVLTDGDSRVTRFIEKPDWKRVFSDLVNTGVYILEPDIFDYIPDTGTPDFGKDVFPALLSGGLPVYGFETAGYWCDVGDQKAYLQAQRDLLQGKVNLPHAFGIHEEAQVDPTAKIEGECFIDAGAIISPGAVIRDAVIGSRAYIGNSAVVENSCLWQDTVVQEKARISGSVLCDGVAVRQGAELADGCALGQRAAVGAFALLRPGVKVWPHFRVAPGAVAVQNVTSGDWSAPHWTAGGVACETAESACALCGAYARVTNARRIMVGHSGAASLAALAAGAFSAAGAETYQAGKMTVSVLGTLIRSLRLDGGAFANGQALLFLDGNGFPLSARITAAMDNCVLRQETPAAFARPGSLHSFRGESEVYLASVLPPENPQPLFSPLAIFCDSPLLLQWAEAGLRRMGARDIRFAPVADANLHAMETGFLLSSDGYGLTVFTAAHTLTQEQRTLLVLALLYRQSGKLYDLPDVPRAAERIAPLALPDAGKECAAQRAVMNDGLYSLFLIADALRRGPLETLLKDLPETHILAKEIACNPKDKGRILHRLCQTQLPHTLGEGLQVQHEKGFASIVPDAHRSVVRITSEAMNSEFAQELCDFYSDQIKKITGIK